MCKKTEKTCDELATTPIPGVPLPLWQGGGAEYLSGKFSLGRREGWLESVSTFDFISHYLAVI